MAQGRMLSKKISLNKAMTKLQNDSSRLVYTWTIAHLDVEGRTHGDPVVLKSIVVPRLKNITADDVENYIKEWVREGLVIWYESEEDMWLEFPGFENNQPGLRKERENPSSIPPSTEGKTIDVEEESGNTPTELRHNGDSNPTELRQDSAEEEEVSLHNRIEQNINRKEYNTSSGTSSRSSPKGSKQQLPDEDKELYHKIKEAFLSQNDTFTNWKKEGEAIKRLVKTARARSPDSPENFIHQMIEKFWQLKQSGDKFWSGQPFLPSALGASGIFDRVLEQFRSEEIPEELKEYYAKKQKERVG